jgi:hypothetical protein
MSQAQATAEQLHPTTPDLRQATINAFERQVEVNAQDFLDKLASSAAPAIGATASLNIAIWGKVTCEPDGQPWTYNNSGWGGPAYFGSAVGFMYTAYDSWDAFFNNVATWWAQAVDAGGGVLQVNWFNRDHTPVGQFNGVAGGGGVAEAGGDGGWQHK